MLQISSYWQPGDALDIDLLAGTDLDVASWQKLRDKNPNTMVEQVLNKHLPKRVVQTFCDWHGWDTPLKQNERDALEQLHDSLRHWQLQPGGPEGCMTAEVTWGGGGTI